MKKILKMLLICSVLLFTIILFKPSTTLAAEIPENNLATFDTSTSDLSSTEGTITDSSAKVDNIIDSTKNIDIGNNLTLTANASSADTNPITYNFVNYVTTKLVYRGTYYSRVNFSLTTTTWSNSKGFYVKAYIYHPFGADELVATQYISKSYSNPVSVTFYLQSGQDYIFKLDNSDYGEQIVGSGVVTATVR